MVVSFVNVAPPPLAATQEIPLPVDVNTELADPTLLLLS